MIINRTCSREENRVYWCGISVESEKKRMKFDLFDYNHHTDIFTLDNDDWHRFIVCGTLFDWIVVAGAFIALMRNLLIAIIGGKSESEPILLCQFSVAD